MTRRILGHLAVTLLTVTALLGAALPAAAITAATQNDLIEIDLPSFRHEAARTYSADIGRLETARALEARYGAKWAVYSWNGLSGTPRHVYGRSVQLTGSLRSADAVESLARQVIVDNYDVLKADVDNLRLHSTPHALGKWVAHFQQTYQGIDVWEARVRVALSDAGKLIVMGSDYYDDIDLNANPTISAGTAIAIATGDLAFNPAKDRVEASPELLVLPVPQSATEVEHHLVWRLTVRTESPLGAWMTHVDAHSGEILWRYNNVHFAFEGDTETDAQVYGICDGVTAKPMPYVNMEVQGVGSATTDANGEWYIAGGGASGTVGATLYGPYIDMNNYGGAEAAFSGTATAGVPFTIDWDDSNSRQDERTSFDAINQVHDFFELFAPGFGYSNTRINCYVNRSDGYCPGNAWWDGTINFCAGSSTYGNTGELAQVVHHEFGHGVQNYIIGGQSNEGLGEGNSDILGNLITQDNVIGRGFYVGNCVSGIRDAVNTLQYPADLNGSVHHDGQIIAGFNWDAMIMLQDLYGGGAWNSPGTIMSAERWHYGRVLMNPTYQDDQVFATFFADDDNDNMDDGTPHHDIFCQAAMNHSYDCPEILVGVFVNHANIPYATNTSMGYAIDAEILSLGGGTIDPGSASVYYRVDGGAYSNTALSSVGGDDYTGTIPGVPFGSVVEYYLEASNNLGSTGTSPNTAPADLHYFQVDDEFIDEMEFQTAWSVGTGTENNASTGNWDLGDPDGTTSTGGVGVQPEDDYTPLGTDCWVTGYVGGGSGGANDVDNGTTTLYSPRFDLTGASDVSISYWRFYTNDRGTNTDDSWVVQLSNDDGASWVDVENAASLPYAWEQVVVNLADHYATPGIVQLRFIAADTGSGSLVEALVDDFLLMGTFDLTGLEDDGMSVAFVTDLKQNSPNPFNPKTQISFSLQQAGHASLKVYDASGRMVKNLADGIMDAGEQTITWNGMDEGGNRVASGVYFYRLVSGEQVISKRMVLLK